MQLTTGATIRQQIWAVVDAVERSMSQRLRALAHADE
jgi:hypothetical protein